MFHTLAALALLLAMPPPSTGGTIRHYAPDDDYDRAILIRCAGGAKKQVPEGKSSRTRCADVNYVGVRRNEEIWCKSPDIPGDFNPWWKAFDAKGWHKIPDLWVDGQGCTVRRD